MDPRPIAVWKVTEARADHPAGFITTHILATSAAQAANLTEGPSALVHSVEFIAHISQPPGTPYRITTLEESPITIISRKEA